jgi:hypothetical protein
MRHAKTINDMAELLIDFDVTVVQFEDSPESVHFAFPNKDNKYTPDKNIMAYIKSSYEGYAKEVKVFKQMKSVIRQLVNNPQFHRCTTVGTQIHDFTFAAKNQYGNMKSRKRKNELLHIIFESQKIATKFMNDLTKLI